jgi:hypothetical protein
MRVHIIFRRPLDVGKNKFLRKTAIAARRTGKPIRKIYSIQDKMTSGGGKIQVKIAYPKKTPIKGPIASDR